MNNLKWGDSIRGGTARIISGLEQAREKQSEIIRMQSDIIDRLFLLILMQMPVEEIPKEILNDIQNVAETAADYSCGESGR